MTIERDADDVARCFLLERELFESGDRDGAFDGEIVGLIGAGAFVAFGDRLQYEGLLPVRRLRERLVGAERAGHDAGGHAQWRRDALGRPGGGPRRADRRATG